MAIFEWLDEEEASFFSGRAFWKLVLLQRS